MRNTNLNKTKIKLTVLFTVLVFVMAVILESVFFTIKYQNNIYVERHQFNLKINSVENKFTSLKELVRVFDVWKRVIQMWKLWEKRIRPTDTNNINIIVFERNKWEIVFSNVIDENIWLEFVIEEFSENDYNRLENEDGYLVKKIKINDNKKIYDILLIKKLNYPFHHYLWDLLGFVFITLLFSAIFYYVWYRFVSRNLKPVEDTLSDMQDFIHNAWHELKTPISIIHSNLQLIKETKTFEKDLIKEWLIEVNRLNHLIESLVELSNINSAEDTYKLDVKEEIKSIIKDFKTEAENKDVKIKFKKIDEKIILINKQYFYILFSNILANAIRYNKEWWRIDITLDKNKITIKDTWIGMNKEDLERIFDRFFMSENSRNNEWHGIWLSLVKKIADIYKMNISVTSEEKKGSEFVIEFYK